MNDKGTRRIAVTGATGFVGRHVVARLEAAGHEVVSLSRRTGTDLAAPDLTALQDGAPPPDLVPRIPCSEEVIRAGPPEPGAFSCRDLRWCRA